jgi:hypothetical protein
VAIVVRNILRRCWSSIQDIQLQSVSRPTTKMRKVGLTRRDFSLNIRIDLGPVVGVVA